MLHSTLYDEDKNMTGHNLSGLASSQNASQVIANQSETGLLRLYPSKDYGLRFPWGGGDLADSGLLRMARYKVLY